LTLRRGRVSQDRKLSANCASGVAYAIFRFKEIDSIAGERMALKDWADAATIIAAIAGVFAVVAALFGVRSAITQTRLQMKHMHLENKKCNTLNICARHELNEIISTAARNSYFNLNYKQQSTIADEDIRGLSMDAIIV
jgi:hypothetical protein